MSTMRDHRREELQFEHLLLKKVLKAAEEAVAICRAEETIDVPYHLRVFMESLRDEIMNYYLKSPLAMRQKEGKRDELTKLHSCI